MLQIESKIFNNTLFYDMPFYTNSPRKHLFMDDKMNLKQTNKKTQSDSAF